MQISVVYEDSNCVVIDKPAGLPSHPIHIGVGDSALGQVCLLYSEIAAASPNPLEGGLVHRLDTGTSGLLVFARTPIAYLELRQAFSRGEIKKTYVALIEGDLTQDCLIEYPIAHHPKNKTKMLAITPKNKYFRGKAKEAKTWVSVLSHESASQTRVQVEISGGRRHQIRVHLAASGHPLVGDVLYGAQSIDWRPGHALHADSLVLPSGVSICSKSEF